MTLPKHIQPAIFDLDGTVLDSLGVWAETDCKFLLRRNIAVPPDYQHAVKSLNFPEAADYTIARFGLEESPAAVMAEWLQLTRGAYACEVGLAPELFLPALERHGLKQLFSTFVTTYDVMKGKHFPDVYLEAAKRLNVLPAECAVFEDVLSAVKTARAAGFYTVAVRDESSAAEEPELRANSDYYLKNYSELL